jgi:hypothetical protein
MTLEFSRQFCDKSSNFKFREICPVEVQYFHTHRGTGGQRGERTDGNDETESRVRSFANALKSYIKIQ